MRKLILKCGLSPGDIVMLTAAVRDLHYWYPGKFLTDVRTVCPELWENNPHLTPLSETDPEVETLQCRYPLINRSNEAPYHCLHGFIEFLNERLDLSIKPTRFKGDIHLSKLEKAWYSQVHELTGEDTPFWIVCAGGKYDVTIKWWQTGRYQQVIDHFRGRIQFVQVGQAGHHHPRLEGVIDLRGQTDLRELVRLVHHSDGVLCSVTALMHLAAAVELKRGNGGRPCVVIAGGREPAHWEAYPGHQFIHTSGALACCAKGGCWKDRTIRLRDGDVRDRLRNRCVDVVHDLPRCMDLITPEEVSRRIETYFAGGSRKYLSTRQRKAAELGVRASANNDYDRGPLNLHNAGMACENFIRTIPEYPDRFHGRGIVICGGGVRYFTNAWVCIRMLRRLGCGLPIELWHLGCREFSAEMETLLLPMGVRCVDAQKVRKQLPVRMLGGWQLKPYAILQSAFREVLLLDADNLAVVNPEFLFETPEFKETGALFWPDYPFSKKPTSAAIWRSCGMREPREPEFESGQIVVDKQRCWAALCLSLWFNEHSDFYYRHLHGDKETFHLAFRKLRKRYSLVSTPIHTLKGVMCQHDFQGNRLFQHRNLNKWDLFLHTPPIKDFWFEAECRDYVRQLRKAWSGSINPQNGTDGESLASKALPANTLRKVKWKLHPRGRSSAFSASTTLGRECLPHPLTVSARAPLSAACTPRVGAVILCYAGTDPQVTLESLKKTDWCDEPLVIQLESEPRTNGGAVSSQLRNWVKQRDYVLLLTGGLQLNWHLRHNIENWKPLWREEAKLASLYNPGVRELACQLEHDARVVEARCAFGHEAILIGAASLNRRLRCLMQSHSATGTHLREIVGNFACPVFYHAPSLAQRMEGCITPAMDFLPDWKAKGLAPLKYEEIQESKHR